MTVPRLTLSELPKVWIVDLDGVVFRHNAYLGGEDEVLDGAVGFWAQIAPDDVVVVMTGRPESERVRTLDLLARLGLRVDRAMFGLPLGERVVVNDAKPSGLPTAHAVNLPRDRGLGGLRVDIDPAL
ncbi:hypothetical protein [Micromonospora sp. WMMD987]|uniref:hypothetical protein n=1 Tax=Micromonospora TaxID=1873 RepID=UPI00249A004F|nr:hypothetical protein [Micromonospora sp. WMMD987]WFE96505.1 hypothetical protein O7612_06305 [Micromonospora sp. WMMD987]